jgi:methylenetetrahydrofolate dehydrogenase (NADP+)/methenyltetrahydrofolate cyclohydrolase
LPAKIIDGIAVSQKLRSECAVRVSALKSRGIVPHLAVILVGDNPASKVYVRNKLKACESLGIESQTITFGHEATTEEIVAAIKALNGDPRVHGILVQLPLPPHVDVRSVISAIDASKDVDGFHLYNAGGLIIGDTVFPPCTPYGVMKLLEHEGIQIEGQNAVVVGASNIVGKPMALMLMQKNATVSVCHIKTMELAQYTIMADILVVAAGRPNLILPQMVKTGAVVIDVGINRLPDGRLVGDIDFEGVRKKASHVTPVPGGVGPMTVTMLLFNTVASAERALNLRAA